MRYTATIGFFDGVHKGHQYIIDCLKADAVSHGMGSTVVTFRQHPRQVLQQDFIPKLLTPATKKISLLQQSGVDKVVALDFTRALASLSAREFMESLHRNYAIDRLLIGYDHRFGHNREEGFNEYVAHGHEIGMEVVCNDALASEGENISSSAIRRCLAAGDIIKANEYLGYQFGFSGTVIHGFGEGRKIGFPTANMGIDPEQFIPERGVYAVTVIVEGFDKVFAGMMNIGCRPTYGEFKETQEVNILDFEDDIYDRRITVAFVDRIRDEKRFSCINELQQQLATDKEHIKNILKW